jgi:NodT family efflux transporter outer membrane factor (OMF) lipoprotein
VLQAQQQLAFAIGNQFPQQQQGTGAAVREKADGATFNNYNLGFNLSWELDFWGRFSRQVESASASLDASVADYDGALVSLIAGVAQNYLLARTTQERLTVAHNNVKLQRESVRITTAKLESGEVSSLDVDQAQTLFYNTQASVASLEQSLQQFKNNLAILMGTPPHDMSDLLGGDHVMPTVSPEMALGMPQDIIRRRPDIRSAERQLAAQSAQVGFAVTELYPHFSIGGSIGTSATHSNDLFGNDYDTWDLFGGFRWNIFNYGRLKSNVRLQDALFQQLLEDYRGTVLRAQGEVENAIVAYIKSQQQFEAYQLAAAAAKRASDISQVQYRNGLVDFNTVITTLKTLLDQQDQLAAVHGTVTTNLVTVYKSLGGGWEIRDNRDPVNLLPESTKDEMLERSGVWKRVLR